MLLSTARRDVHFGVFRNTKFRLMNAIDEYTFFIVLLYIPQIVAG